MAFGEILREFGVKVGLDFDAKKFEKAQDSVEKLGSKLRGVAFEIAGATAGLFAIGKAATSFARGTQNQADLLGISTDALQEYSYAANIAADATQEDLVGAFESLSTTLDKARAGDVGARQSLLQIGREAGNEGLILDHLADKNYKVTDAFKAVSAAAQNLSEKGFGIAAKRTTELALGSDKLYNLMRRGPKALDQLTEEAKKNSVVSSKMIAEGNRLDIQLSKIFAIFRKFGVEIGIMTMQKLMPLIKQFTAWVSKNKELIASGFIEFVKEFVAGLGMALTAVQFIAQALSPLIDSLGGAKNAVKLLVDSFLVFKTISIAGSIAQSALALGSLGVAAAPLIAAVAGLTAFAAILQSIWSVLSGGKIEDTWLGKAGDAIDKLTAGHLNFGDKIYDFFHPEAAESPKGAKPNTASAARAFNPVGASFAAARPTGPATSGGAAQGAPQVQQSVALTTNNTFQMAPGANPAQVSAAVSKGTVDAHEKLMIKAKADTFQRRVN